MKYNDMVLQMVDLVLKLNNDRLDITLDNNQATCWFIDNYKVVGSVDINNTNPIELIHWDNDPGTYKHISKDRLFKLITEEANK